MPRLRTAAAAIAAAGTLPLASAWGTLGHETVAFIAQNFVSADTAAWAQGILDVSSSSSYLASVATWADSYRYTTEGAFSAEYHYIDANDSPPDSCGVELERDCPDSGCIVSAIANYTSRVQSSSVSSTEKQMALKWIIHFLGDIHQPLHDEALEVGGNGIDVTYDGESTNLHHIWDSNMPEQLIGGYALSDAESWATTLTTAIKSGAYASEAAGWLDGMDVDDAQASALVWAQDTNKYVCSVVLPDGVSAVESGDLSGTYYDDSIDTIKLQVAKAGYRLAAWLDLIATGETGLSKMKRDMSVKREDYVFPPEGWARRDNSAERQKHKRHAIGCTC
ncbi:s1 p1 nuclease [Diplodia corticola]|uniref:S1 p1 nuclease n=1 Tax=Diplodia corticola TaxID=236234 RepID=A0A1J9R155_9PEZI|nr:s1 p1 nuclease [Diplodia corticola]OJD33978.1 s1 p1 nuclease [Diplodia corticola]